jgi:hypothetical protein
MRWRWPFRRAGAPPPPMVTGEQRDGLDAAKRLLVEKQRALAARVPEINRVTAFIERERRRNHFGERVWLAFGLDGHDKGGRGNQ